MTESVAEASASGVTVHGRTPPCDTVRGLMRQGPAGGRELIVQDTAPGTAGPPAPPPRSAVPGEETLDILIAEDDPADALLTRELLDDSMVTASVACVTTAREAAAAVHAGGVDCVVLDLHLPDLHGIGALGSWLATVPSTAVVVMTGLDDRAAGLAAVRAGAQDYLVKGQVEAEWFGRTVRYAVQRKRTERAAADLRAARWRAAENVRLERGLLPSPLLRTAPVAVTARYLPHRDGALLGGDFFDVVETADGTVHAVIGDVSGHGPDEAALGVALRVAWRTLVLTGQSGPELVDSLERVLLAERRDEETYTTLATLRWRPEEPVASLVRAGHPEVMTRGGGEAVLHEAAHGPALGLLPGLSEWPVTSLHIGRAGEVVLYTDGLFENRDETGSLWGQSRMLAAANRLSGLEGEEFVDRLIAETRDRTGRGDCDDVAVLHLRHLDSDGVGAEAKAGGGR
jgi:serine phosphatase RsbU (regulator of sigma subunit)